MSKRTTLWLAAALTYAVFVYWYTDFGGPLKDSEVDAFVATLTERGGNPEIGCVLPGVLDRAGLDVELGMATKAIRPATPEWRWPDSLFRQILPMLVDKGHLARETLDDFLAAWEERSRDPTALFFSSPVLEVIGRRPGASSAAGAPHRRRPHRTRRTAPHVRPRETEATAEPVRGGSPFPTGWTVEFERACGSSWR